MKAWLERRWYSDRPPPLLLRPLAAMYGAIAAQRRARLRGGGASPGLPVIVVGNISVGGTGKTPFVIWLVERLREWGFAPGIVSRGYGGRAPHHPFMVTATSAAEEAGDEPLLLARRLGVPLMVDPDRVAAARALAASGAVDVIVSDDGLQHYPLARELEFCVVDAARGLGNGALMPAGPLREPAARLGEVDFIVANGVGFRPDSQQPLLHMSLALGEARALVGDARLPLAALRGQRAHALAGIGHPKRFFDDLRGHGIEVVEHPFADHHKFCAPELAFGDALPVLMTEKDAVKCAAFAGPRHWFVPVDASLGAEDTALVRKSVLLLKARA